MCRGAAGGGAPGAIGGTGVEPLSRRFGSRNPRGVCLRGGFLYCSEAVRKGDLDNSGTTRYHTPTSLTPKQDDDVGTLWAPLRYANDILAAEPLPLYSLDRYYVS